ncbi:hypothetical protein ACP70R_048637 [Stipagrostis hirtigluma subsp. patula]
MNLPETKVTELIQGADRSKWMVHSNKKVKCFTKGEIEIITNNYRTMIGRGGFGEVFQGVLADRSIVAVKRFIHNVKENFAKELIVHREINHKNVVRLIGYCVEENALMMVTEYVANGNLSDVLHHDNSHLPLDVRLRIAIECAEALAYMHSYMYTQVIHGDIKPANILLDRSFNAKLSDFGISRLVNTEKTLYTDNVKGSIGYMDPLFARDGRLTVKSDVYSFGVVLLELITRKKPTTEVGKANLVDMCTKALARGMKGAREIFDSNIASQNNMKFLEGVANLAGECLRMERDRRPEMIDVAKRLQMLRNASHKGEKRVDLFSWVRKSKPAPPALVRSTSSISIKTLPCRQFSFAEMKAATNNFDELLLVSESKFCRVYRGEIDGGETRVTIKLLQFEDANDREGFHSKIELRWKLHHRHLVPLVGYCVEEENMILVYDYMSRGSLREHLYNTQNDPLTWKQRVEICIGAARGLHYLHKGAEHAIIHHNVNLANILLDDEWVAKISDGIEADPHTTETCYRCYWHSDVRDPLRSWLTEKSDVYSFGAVLFEVLCARPLVDRTRPNKQVHLLYWAACCKLEGHLHQIADPYLKGKLNTQCLIKFVETAESCLAFEDTDRPSLGDVILDLEYVLQLQESAEASEHGSGSM